jgi:hypothetical protein
VAVRLKKWPSEKQKVIALTTLCAASTARMQLQESEFKDLTEPDDAPPTAMFLRPPQIQALGNSSDS